jgi:anti-anti-sigma factor
MATAFHIDLRRSPGVTVLTAVGELDISSAHSLLAQVRAVTAEDGDAAIIIDLRAVPFMDSTGLRALLTAEELCREVGRSLTVIRGPRQVQRVLAIARATERLNLRDDVEASSG